MEKKWIFVLIFVSTVLGYSSVSMADSPAGCDDQGRCFWLNLTNQTDAPVTFMVENVSCYEGDQGLWTVSAQGQKQIGLARMQGHGCDGRNGVINITTNGQSSPALLAFTNDLSLLVVSVDPKSDMTLSSRGATDDGWAYYQYTFNGPWLNPPMCGSDLFTNRCFQLYIENALSSPVTWILSAGICYEGTLGTFTIQPGEGYQVAIARIQGNGCDGKNGEFTLTPNVPMGQAQSMAFDNQGQLWTTNTPTNYMGVLYVKAADGSYTYRSDENISHTSTSPASTIGDWNNAKTTQVSFTTNTFFPNYYESCAGVEVFHPQHVIRLPNDSQGNAYFMVSQSREHNGYLTLLKVKSTLIDKSTDAVIGDNGAVVGTAVWQTVYTGEYNRTYNPVGNWNHPGKMTYIDGVLAVAAQNWDADGSRKFACGYWYDFVGTSDDKILFYDVTNVTSPKYMGGMAASDFGVSDGELGSLEIVYNPAGANYLLNAGGGGAYQVKSAQNFNPSSQSWYNVSSMSFTGQHGIAFSATTAQGTQLWYFDASSSGFSFSSYDYLQAPPYLQYVNKHEVDMSLPGASRDWDASSLYISSTTRKPIVYTVKSVEGDDYQLYQVIPNN